MNTEQPPELDDLAPYLNKVDQPDLSHARLSRVRRNIILACDRRQPAKLWRWLIPQIEPAFLATALIVSIIAGNALSLPPDNNNSNFGLQSYEGDLG